MNERPLAASSLPEKRGFYCTTQKGTLLESVPSGVSTSTVPLVAPAGTVALINELDATVNVAAVLLNVTLVAPFRLVPRILTGAPTCRRSAAFPRTGRDPQTA